MLDVASVHVIEFFNEVDECLGLNEALTELLLVLGFGILLEIEDVVSCGLVIGSLDIARLTVVVVLLTIFGVLLVKIFKVIDQIKKKIEKKLLDAKSELTLMQLLLMDVSRFIFLVSLIC